MKALWAPWRMQYIQKPPGGVCIFCRSAKGKNDKRNYIVTRKRYCFSMLNIFPYNNGHLLAAPCAHIGKLEDLTSAQRSELMELVTESVCLLRKQLRPHGFNVGMNLGSIAGAGFPGHLHVHIVPRWRADTNFMPVFSRTKVISQALDALYASLVDTEAAPPAKNPISGKRGT